VPAVSRADAALFSVKIRDTFLPTNNGRRTDATSDPARPVLVCENQIAASIPARCFGSGPRLALAAVLSDGAGALLSAYPAERGGSEGGSAARRGRAVG